MRRHAVCLWLATAILVGYQSWLTLSGGEQIVLYGLDGRDARDTIFDADREWFTSLAGYCVLYLLGMQWAVYSQDQMR
jgi:hypothetical protein